MASVNLPPAKTGHAASQDEQREFLTLFPDIVRELTDVGMHSDIPDAQKWYAKVGMADVMLKYCFLCILFKENLHAFSH